MSQHVVGSIQFAGPGVCLWESQPTLRELYDQACAGLIRAEREMEELRAEVALLRAERQILKGQIDGYRYDACRESCQDKAAADGGWANI
jgi:hypothetical protein